MTAPQVWVDHVQQDVRRLLADYPALSNRGNAFAMWTLQQLHGLTEEEALEAAASPLGGPADAGIDGIVSDDSAQVLYLMQAKYAENLAGDFDESAASELLSALDLLLNAEYASEAGSAFLAARERLLGAMAGGSDVVLEVVLAGQISQQGRDRISAYVSSLQHEQIRLEIFDVDALWRLHQDQAEGEDLADTWVEFETIGSPLLIPSDASGVLEAHITVIDGASLIPAVQLWGRRLVASNLRHLLKTSRVNDSIAKSTTTDALKQRFVLLNNGLTITCREVVKVEGAVKLLNPQIVNGGQTTMTLFANRSNFVKGDVKLLARVIATEDSLAGRALALEIAEATNRQNPITAADLKANDDRQKFIQAALAAMDPPWFYERRRNERSSLPAGRLATFAGVITKEDLGQRWRAFEGQPAVAITGKQAMFTQQTLYGDIFSVDIDVRQYVLAYELFELFYDLLGSSAASVNLRRQLVPQLLESERGELTRARNQWAAHCSALTGRLLRDRYGDISIKIATRLTTDTRMQLRSGDGDFAGLIRLVVVAVHKWFRGKKMKAQEEDVILALKAEFEKPEALVALVAEAEAYQALLAGMPQYALPDL